MKKLDRFMELYRTLSADNLHELEEIYADDIRFVDPAHEIKGLEELQRYFNNLYQNLASISFDYHQVHESETEASISWSMTFTHPRISRGKEITLQGATFLEFDHDNKISYHRDYFDLGAMLYEHLPIVGPVTKFIKNRLGT
jgi:hypothetical protein